MCTRNQHGLRLEAGAFFYCSICSLEWVGMVEWSQKTRRLSDVPEIYLWFALYPGQPSLLTLSGKKCYQTHLGARFPWKWDAWSLPRSVINQPWGLSLHLFYRCFVWSISSNQFCRANVRSKHVQLYNGCIDCFVKIIRQEGFFSLYKGFLPSYIRMAPWSLTFWVSYEEIRKFVGAPSF